MIIAIDYDGTWTADPDLWAAFSRSAQARGHEVWCITARSPAMMAEVFAVAGAVLGADRCLAADREPKARAFERLTGRTVDIWIDDTPEMIRPLARSASGLLLPA